MSKQIEESDPTKDTDTKPNHELFCTFCGTSQYEVRKLIAGPTVYICDECVGLCADIVAEEMGFLTKLPVPYNETLYIQIPSRIMYDTDFDLESVAMLADPDKNNPKHLADLTKQIGIAVVKSRKDDILRIANRDVDRVQKVIDGARQRLSELQAKQYHLSPETLRLILESQGKSTSELTDDENARLERVSKMATEAAELEELQRRAERRCSELIAYVEYVKSIT